MSKKDLEDPFVMAILTVCGIITGMILYLLFTGQGY